MDSSHSNITTICCACLTELLVGESFLQCMVETCGKLYHKQCTNISESVTEQGSWVCPECVCSIKKTGSNCDTPVGSPHFARNVTHRKKETSPILPLLKKDEVTVSATDLLSFRSQVANLTKQLESAVTTIASYQIALRDTMSNVKAISEKLQAFEQKRICGCDRGCNEPAPQTVIDKPRKALNKTCETSTKAEHNRISDIKLLSVPTLQPQVSASVMATQFQPQISPVNPQSQCQDKIPSVATQPTKVFGQQYKKHNKVQSQKHTKHPLCPQSKSAGFLDPSLCSETTQSVPDQNQTIDQWTAVAKKKARRVTSLCGTAGPATTSLKAMEAKKYLHLWNMASGSAEIRDYLRQLCPDGACTVEELSARGDYKSYKIGVPVALYEKCYSTDVWPVNAKIKAWINYTPSANVSSVGGPNTDSRPFRERPFHGQTGMH